MRTLNSFLMVSVGCAALLALVPACGSTDSSGGGTAGSGTAGSGTAGASAAGSGAGGGSSAGAGTGGGSTSMNTATTGNATTGATLYTKMTSPGSCDSCHGADAGGNLGPNISGATPAGLGGWKEEQFYQVVRNSNASNGKKVCGLMPAYTTTDLSDQDIADIYAFTQSKMVATAQMGSYAQSLPDCATK